MSTTSQKSLNAPATPTVVSRLSALARQAFSGIDLLSLQLAAKTSLAIVLAIGIAFWLDLSATITAVTALMIQQGYVGATMQRGLLRLAGGTAGAALGLVLLALFGQDRVLFIGSMALCVGAIAYLLQGTRNWYAYILVVASMVLVGFGNIEHPQYAFQFSVTWVSGILIAIVVVSLVHGLLWPTPTAAVFDRLLREHIKNCRTLVRMASETLVGEPGRHPELLGIEQRIILGLPKLFGTLQTATFDSWRIEKYEASYHALLDQVTKLSRGVIQFNETVKICQAQPAVADGVRRSEAFRQIMHELDGCMQSAIAAVAEPRDGKNLPDRDQELHTLTPILARLAEEAGALQSDPFGKGAWSALNEKIRQLGTQIRELRTALASVETTASLAEARASAKEHTRDAPPWIPRLLKSSRASLVMIVVPCVWIFTNWPMALMRLMLYSSVLACLSCLLPVIPRRGILNAIAAGAIGGALLYFGILRPLDGYLQLALALFVVAVPYCYWINSPRPTVMITGLFGGMIMLGLIDLSLVQDYSFSNYTNNVIGYSGGFLIGMIVLQLFASSTPEQTFCGKVQVFFRTCEQTLDALSADPPWTDRGKTIASTREVGLLKTLGMCGLWSRIINPRRAPHNDAKKVGAMLASMQSLAFRIGMTEEARWKISGEEPFAALIAAEHNLRATLGMSLRGIQDAINTDAVTDALPNIGATMVEYHRQLEALRDHPATDKIDRVMAGQFLVLAEYYRALADAVERCQKDVAAIDWPSWERTYI